MEAVREKQSYDRWLLWLTVSLLLIGWAVVLDASYSRAMQSKWTGYDPLYFFKKQGIAVALSLVVLSITLKVPYWKLKDWRIWFGGAVVAGILLILVLIPGIGIKVNGSRRWLGAGPFTFQPSELAKIALVIFLARYSDLWRGRVRHLTKGFIPPVLAVFVLGGLVAIEDLGTAITVIGTGLLMILMMGARPAHMLGLVMLAVLGGIGLILVEPYRMERVQVWTDLMFHPLAHHDGAAYQPAQGLIALGSGGIAGLGIMRGGAKHLYLPAEHTDYIFSTIGEETGLLGTVATVLMFAGLVVLGLNIAHRTRDWFGSLLAAGFTTMIGMQAMLNIGVVTGLVPPTGVPLPFLSYGGSSVVFTTLAVGIILNVSQYPGGPVPESRGKKARESRSDGWRNRRPHLSRT